MTAYDLHHKKYIDPGDQVIIHHIRAIHSLIHAWPTEQLAALEQAWTTTYNQLQTKQYPWYTVRGPMAGRNPHALDPTGSPFYAEQ